MRRRPPDRHVGLRSKARSSKPSLDVAPVDELGLAVFRQSYMRCVTSNPRKTRNKYGKEIFQL